jgi:hypothetical protein
MDEPSVTLKQLSTSAWQTSNCSDSRLNMQLEIEDLTPEEINVH